eukprot:Nk52_evm8s169 gene=Nk52_evmTU8s169
MVSLSSSSQATKYRGAAFFRQRLILSTLSGRPMKISHIRSAPSKDQEGLDSYNPGLSGSEIKLLKLFDLLCNGSSTVISDTGTTLLYKPGSIVGGSGLVFDCGAAEQNGEDSDHQETVRGVSYYAEAVLCIAPFAKKDVQITLRGVTNGVNGDLSVDSLRTVVLPVLRQFGVSRNGGGDDSADFHLKITKRGAFPKGGGEIQLKCPVVRELNPVELMDFGKIKRVRGIAYTTRCSPQNANRMVDSSRGVLNNLLPDVYIFTDHYKGADSGLCPGYGINLVAETTTGCLLFSERNGAAGCLPEEIGKAVSYDLFEEVANGGCVSSNVQWMVLLWMVLCPEDVSRVRMGTKLTDYSVQMLRHIRDFFGVTFKVKVIRNPMKKDLERKRKKQAEEEAAAAARKLKNEQKKKNKKGKGANKKMKMDPEDEDELAKQNEKQTKEEEEEEEEEEDEEVVVCSCVGIGYKNMSKKVA